MRDKKTVFVLGAGASCPYGFPSGARLRELICLDIGFISYYREYLGKNKIDQAEAMKRDAQRFKDAFTKSHIKSIDVFMANNPKLAPIGKYIVAFEVFRAEQQSCYGEEAKQKQEQRREPTSSRSRKDCILGTSDFIGGDWYSYLYNRLIVRLVGKNALMDFSSGEIAFITFNYDRSIEHFFYESLRNSFKEVPEDNIVQTVSQLKILHVYGRIMPLKWQDSNEGVDYKPQEISESLLQNAASNIKTIYEQKESSELIEAQGLLEQAEQIFFLGFGYAPENMDVLGLSGLIPRSCQVYGTAYRLETKEINDIRDRIVMGLNGGFTDSNLNRVSIENVDCLKLLRDQL